MLLSAIDSLGYNGIGPKGATALAEALKVNQTVQALKVNQTVQALKVNQTVQDLKCGDARFKAAKAHGVEARDLGVSPSSVPRQVLDRDSESRATNTIIFLQAALFGEDALHQLKVVVVGPQRVGKTTLTNALLQKGKSANPTTRGEDKETTISVDVVQVPFKVRDDLQSKRGVLGIGGRTAEKPCQISLWDFGGQEEYYMTHALFLSSRSLVMVVVDMEVYEDTDASFETCAGNWLRALQVQLVRPRVVVVGTKADKVDASLGRAKMDSLVRRINALNARVQTAVREFGNGEFEGLRFTDPAQFLVSGVNLKEGDGVVGLYDFLCEMASDTDKGIALRVPRSFEDLRVLLRKQAEEGVRVVEFSQLLHDTGLSPDALRLALSLLHDLGVVLFYEHNPSLSGVVFVEPRWVVELIRSVFRHDLFVRPESGKPGTLFDLKKAPVELQKKLQETCVLDERLLCLFPVWRGLDGPTLELGVNLLVQFALVYEIPRDKQGDPREFMTPLFLRKGFSGALQSAGKRRGSRLRDSMARVLQGLRRSQRRDFSSSATTLSQRYEFFAFVPHGLFLRFVARSHRLAEIYQLEEHRALAKAKFTPRGEKSVYVLFEEVRDEQDGTGRVDISCAVESAEKGDVDNLSRTFRLFVDEMDQVLQDSFRQVPFKALVLDAEKKRGVMVEDLTKAQEDGSDRVDTYDTQAPVLARQPSGKVLVAEHVPLAEELLKLAVDPRLKKRTPYQVRRKVDQAIVHQLKLADKSLQEILEEAQRQLNDLRVYRGLAADDVAFGLHEDDSLRAEISNALKRPQDHFVQDRALVEALCELVRRCSTRLLRTQWDAFWSHSWGEGQVTHWRVVKLADRLRDEHGIASWVDDKDMEGQINSAMATGISQSQTFCTVLTTDYADKVREQGKNGNCGREYFYAENHKDVEDFVPLVLDQDMRNPDELEGMIAVSGALYFDLVDPSKDDQVLAQVAATILKRLFPFDDETDREQLLQLYPATSNVRNL
ncbi:Probable serine/threonine-protein kinase roco5 (Ras of complex proteins and C-terminal of roc 5) [Durusdinium trenchii]|uniref:non-specific serine/threonine protein kinase n=1 Tax=Durusdinium trenchii TaxID=1381693 RepID=A0ABP0L9H2_9DINO